MTGINLFSGFEDDDENLIIKTEKDENFNIPFSRIKNSAVYNHNEIELDMQFEEHNENHDILCEVRFFIPNVEKAQPAEEEKKAEKDGMDEEKGKEGKEQEGMDEEKEEPKSKLTLADEFHNMIRRKAKIDESMGELICTVENLSLIVPRGKYTIDLHKENMRLHGSTFNYRILYKDVVKAFILPMNDGIHTCIVVGFSRALRQGNTMYPYIIFQFKRNKQLEIDLKLGEEELKSIHNNLQPTYNGPAYEVVAKLFKMIIGVNIIIPGNFKTTTDHSSIKCNVGNQEGYLFLMNKSMIFIKKPVIYIRLSEVARVEFQRVTGGISIRAFDFEVILKSGVSTTFAGADKRELESIRTYFAKAKITVKTINELEKYDELGSDDDDDDVGIIKDDEMPDDDDDENDDDFVAPDGDDDDDDDADFEMDDE